MPGFRHVVRCAQCGHLATDDIGFNSRCTRCGTELHSCAQCASFDPGSRFECMQPIPERVSPKNTRNALLAFRAADDGGARNDDAAKQRRAKGVRRPLQFLSVASFWDSDTVSLLSDQDRHVVREHLAAIQQPVTLLLFTQTIGAPETALLARQVLDEVASLNDLIRVEEVNFVLERDRAAQYGIEHIPAIVLLSGDEDTRMRFLGAPAGYEFMSLIEAVILAGTNDSQPDAGQSRAHLRARDRARSTSRSSSRRLDRIAREPCRSRIGWPGRTRRFSASCVEATEFMDLSRKFRVTGVPKTIVNGSIEILGALPEELFVRSVLGLPEADSPPPRSAL